MGDYISNLIQRSIGLAVDGTPHFSASRPQPDSAIASTIVRPDMVPFDKPEIDDSDDASMEVPNAEKSLSESKIAIPGHIPLVKPLAHEQPGQPDSTISANGDTSQVQIQKIETPSAQSASQEIVEGTTPAIENEMPKELTNSEIRVHGTQVRPAFGPPASGDTIESVATPATENEIQEIQTNSVGQTRDIQVKPASEIPSVQNEILPQIREIQGQTRGGNVPQESRIYEGIPKATASPKPSWDLSETSALHSQITSQPASPVEQQTEEKIESITVIRPAMPQSAVETQPIADELPGLPKIKESTEASSMPPSVQVKVGTIEVQTNTPEPVASRPAPSPKGQGFDEYMMIRNYINWI